MKNNVLDYLISLLVDSNDFLWQAAKASDAVLSCQMEGGAVTSWSQMDTIDPESKCTKNIFLYLRQ